MDVLDFIRENDVANALARTSALQSERGQLPYEPRWNRRLQRFRAIIESGESSLARVIASATTRLDHDPLETVEAHFWLGEPVEADHLLISAQRRALVDAVLRRACAGKTDAIVELGSGDGLNLFHLWLAGGPARARYMALEITTTGRLCAQLLGRLEPRMRLSAHAFDYFEPDYSDLPDGLEHLVVFTCGSIEQIQTLPEEAITGLLDRAARVTGIHFEPVSWQMPGCPHPRHAAEHRERCERNGYNANLWRLLTSLQEAGRIEVTQAAPYVFGQKKHPSALISWRTT